MTSDEREALADYTYRVVRNALRHDRPHSQVAAAAREAVLEGPPTEPVPSPT